jgi:hypothetical protein
VVQPLENYRYQTLVSTYYQRFFFCENLNDVNDFPVGREEVVVMNSDPFVLANQYPELSPTCQTETLDQTETCAFVDCTYILALRCCLFSFIDWG